MQCRQLSLILAFGVSASISWIEQPPGLVRPPSLGIRGYGVREYSSKSGYTIRKIGIIPLLSSKARITAMEWPSDSLGSGFSRPAIVESPGKELWIDVKKKAPHYLSDFVDGLNVKTLSATVFLFFACIAPAVAFGTMLSMCTAGQMGPIEMISSTAGCSIAYALTAGQPLTIIGSTGPVLAFIAALYKLADRFSLPFLPLYSWVGLWTSFYLFLSSIFSLSNVVGYFSRFTDEIFSLLISIIFIIESLKDLIGLYYSPETSFMSALLSSVIAACTFTVVRRLSTVRKTPYFSKPLREAVSDFAPPIGILVGVAISSMAASQVGITLPTLQLPSSFTTSTGRPWLVPLTALPVIWRWIAAIPALMGYVLLFIDQNITIHLVNSKEHKLKKSHGLHLDMMVVALLAGINSLLGLPWLVAATVRSMVHVKSLTNYGQKVGGKEEIVDIKEQRLSAFSIHLLIGASILYLRPYLSLIPVSGLMGLFLYLGVNGMENSQLVDRMNLLLMDHNLRHKNSWATKVPIRKANLFTLIQLSCVGAIMCVKSSRFGVFFPVIIALLAPLRFALERANVFSKDELAVLDDE